MPGHTHLLSCLDQLRQLVSPRAGPAPLPNPHPREGRWVGTAWFHPCILSSSKGPIGTWARPSCVENQPELDISWMWTRPTFIHPQTRAWVPPSEAQMEWEAGWRGAPPSAGGGGAPVTALGGQSIRWCLCPPCSPAHAPPAEMRFPPAHFKGSMTSFWAISPPCRLGSLWGFGIRTVPIPPGASASPVRPWVMAYIYHGDQNPGPSLRSSHSWETELARCQSRKSKVTTLSELLSEKHWWHDST